MSYLKRSNFSTWSSSLFEDYRCSTLAWQYDRDCQHWGRIRWEFNSRIQTKSPEYYRRYSSQSEIVSEHTLAKPKETSVTKYFQFWSTSRKFFQTISWFCWRQMELLFRKKSYSSFVVSFDDKIIFVNLISFFFVNVFKIRIFSRLSIMDFFNSPSHLLSLLGSRWRFSINVE